MRQGVENIGRWFMAWLIGFSIDLLAEGAISGFTARHTWDAAWFGAMVATVWVVGRRGRAYERRAAVLGYLRPRAVQFGLGLLCGTALVVAVLVLVQDRVAGMLILALASVLFALLATFERDRYRRQKRQR